MRYTLKHTDKYGSRYRGTNRHGELAWGHLGVTIAKYELFEILEILKKYGSNLAAGEKLEIEAVIDEVTEVKDLG